MEKENEYQEIREVCTFRREVLGNKFQFDRPVEEKKDGFFTRLRKLIWER